jgi:hypothetical protein
MLKSKTLTFLTHVLHSVAPFEGLPDYLYYMELVLKIPDGKPPFIGIEGVSNSAVFEWMKSRATGCTITLDPSHKLVLWVYKGAEGVRHVVDYDPALLLRFILMTAPVYNFAFVYRDGPEYKIQEIEGVKMALKISKLGLEPSAYLWNR